MVRIRGTLNTDGYIQILQEEVGPFFAQHPNFLFQQDNAPPHKAVRSMRWLADNGINLLPHPPNSPDLNPLENAWSYLKNRLDSEVVHDYDELFAAAVRIWNAIPPRFVEELFDSMPERCRQVIQKNGGSTTY